MSNGIPLIPEVPDEIRDAVNNGTLAVFIGAGVSRLVGCRGWDTLARNLVSRCHSEGIINFKENETLSQISDHKKTITICYHLFNNKHLADVFYEEMNRSLGEGADIETPNIYDDIYRLRGLFITTNADTHFDRLFNLPNILYRTSEFKEDRLDRTNLYHIHGSVRDRDSLIFTVPGYMQRYTNPEFRRFLGRIFREYTVLFLGYGVAEFEILEFILQDYPRTSALAPRHFMLSPFYSGEDNILSYEQTYYKDLGINILGYEKDAKGYRQLIEVIRHWNKEINQVTGYLHDAFRLIDEAVDGVGMSTDKITKTLQMIKNDKSLEDHLFKELAVASKPLELLVPLRDAGYFSPENNPKPQEVPSKKGYYTVPHWNILDALKNMTVKNKEHPNDEVSKILLEIVDGIITYRENGERIDNYRTDWKLLVTISLFPIEYISSRHIQFIKDALRPSIWTSPLDHEIGRLFLPKLIMEGARDLIIELLNVILHYRKSDREHIREYISVLDPFYLKEALDKNKKGISEICAIEAADVAITKMHEILKGDKSQINYVWIPAIENHEQTSFPDKYECQLVHFVRDMLAAADPAEIEPIVKNMLCEEHDIFKRLAYHLINHHYDALSHLLWRIPYNPLDSLTIHELYELFKSHCKSFDETQIETILNWIETQDFHFPNEVSGIIEKEEHIKAYYKKEWLLALLGSENKEVKRRYETYNSINDATIEHPGFHYWSSGVYTVQDVSPIDEDELKKKTNDEIAAYINLYKDEEYSCKDTTRVNLASSVRKFISNDPVRFATDLKPFLAIPRKYQYEFLRGFEEAWRNNRDFDWQELLPFMKKLIGDGSFWSEEKKEGGSDYNRWIADTIADLIQEGTKNDKHAFSPDLLPITEQIILLLLKNVKSEMSMMNDLVTSVLNSSKGKVFMAAINYSLRYARLYGRDKKNRWVESIKYEFTERLDKTKEPGLEFSIVIGQYLLNLNYLDNQWVVSNFNKIFDLESDKHWEAAFIGYIVMTSTVSEEMYKLLRDNGHYEKGLLYSFGDEHAADKLVQNIAIGYLAGWDDLADATGLLRKLLKTGSTEHISELVTFMWTSRDKDDKKFIRKIKPLWKAIIEILTQNIEKEEYRIIASKLVNWLSLVHTIDDDIYEWLQISVKVRKENWDFVFFIEYLRRHVMKTPTTVGNLYLKMLDAGNYPDYKKEDIVAIVQALYDLKEKETANRICNIYRSKGFEFLRETFEKNN